MGLFVRMVGGSDLDASLSRAQAWWGRDLRRSSGSARVT